jgi:flagellar biogenesis protein FliO
LGLGEIAKNGLAAEMKFRDKPRWPQVASGWKWISPSSLSADAPQVMQRIRINSCKSLAALGLWALCCSLSTPSVSRGQELNFQSPPLAPLTPAPTSQPIFDSQVRTTDFQTAAANGQGLALQPIGDGQLNLPNTAPAPLANAIREFIEPTSPKANERTNSSLFSLAALQLNDIDWKKMLASLGIVVGGYLALMYLLRMWSPQAAGALPREVVEVLGNLPLNPKQNLQLVRLGSKLLLLIHGPEGTHSIGEISNPNEVEHLTQLCSQRRGRKGPTAFRKFSEGSTREPQSNIALDSLLKNLQLALQRTPARTEYEA